MFSVILRGWCFWHNFNFPFVPKFENIPHNYFCVLSQPWGKLKEKMWLWKLTVSTLSHEFLLYCKIHPDFPCLCQGLSQNLAHIESVSQFSHSVMLDSLQPHELQHARPPSPSPTPGVYSNSCPLSLWCHPTISPSVIPFSSCPQSFPASGSFQMSQLYATDGKSIGVSASASVLPMNIQSWFPLGLTGLISLLSKGPKESSLAPQFESISSLALSLLYGPTLTSIHDYWKQ